jgi:hypothetical protein
MNFHAEKFHSQFVDLLASTNADLQSLLTSITTEFDLLIEKFEAQNTIELLTRTRQLVYVDKV